MERAIAGGIYVKKILIIEDDPKLARFIELELKHEGYEANSIHNGRDGLDAALAGEHDLIILDLMLPGLNGMEICRRVRQHSQIPIIMLTARDDVMDKVMGLDQGADDYITKPFAIEELLARIRVLERRLNKSNSLENEEMVYGPLKISLSQHSVTCNDQLVDLTPTEFDLLVYLAKNINIALSRNQILDGVWGEDYFGNHKIVDVYIRYLRSKLDDEFDSNYIHTIRGVGYSFRYEKEKEDF
jgi:DNA-binding response OmpR family regulator